MAATATASRKTTTVTKSAPTPKIDPRFGMPVHPAADLLPIIDEDALNALAQDIKKHGLLEPVITYNGMILDGRNRLLACKKAKVTPTFREWKPGPDDLPSVFVMSANLHRRHLTQSQRAAAAVKLERQIAEDARALREAAKEARNAEAMQARLFSEAPKGTGKRTAAAPFKAPPSPAFSSGRARDVAAKAAGVSTGYLNDAKNLQKADPKRFEAVERGELTLPKAQEEHVREAIRKGTLDDSALRPAVKNTILEKIEAKKAAKEADKAAKKQKASSVRKFSKVATSRVTINIKATFGSVKVAEEWLAKMEDDTRVMELSFTSA